MQAAHVWRWAAEDCWRGGNALVVAVLPGEVARHRERPLQAVALRAVTAPHEFNELASPNAMLRAGSGGGDQWERTSAKPVCSPSALWVSFDSIAGQ